MEKKSETSSVLNKKAIKAHFFRLTDNLLDASGEKAYRKFLLFLIILDLLGFATIATDNFFGWHLGNYNEFVWIFFFALGLIVISNVKRIKKISVHGFKSESFAGLATLIIGILALITAFLSLPFFSLDHPVLRSIKGIIALIAMVYIVLEAWVVHAH